MKACNRFGLFFPLFALMAGGAAAQTPDEAPRSRDLKIVVVDGATQRPVTGAQVSTFGREPLKLLTDESGVAVLPVRTNPPSPEKNTMFQFEVTHPGYESRRVEWFSDGGQVQETVPAQY